MALQCPTNIFSTDFEESYHQVIQVIYKAPAVNGDGGNAQVTMAIWSCKESRDADMDSPLTQSQFEFNLDISKASQNPVKKAYDYLKTQDGYADAVDV
jgi:hypothetical protein